MASKGSILRGVVERLASLRRIVPDSAGRVRVAIETSSNTQLISGSVTVTTVTNWGLYTATSFSQQHSDLGYQSGFRRNLVVS